MSSIHDDKRTDTSAARISTNLGNWYQRSVLEKSTENEISIPEVSTHLGNWYARNVLRNLPDSVSATVR